MVRSLRPRPMKLTAQCMTTVTQFLKPRGGTASSPNEATAWPAGVSGAAQRPGARTG